MPHKLPILLALGVFAAICHQTIAQDGSSAARSGENEPIVPSLPNSTANTKPTLQPTRPAPPQGNELLPLAARRLAVAPPLEAKVIQRVSIFGRELKGASGRYMQLGKGTGMTLLELKMKAGSNKVAAGRLSSLQQICGPDYYYTRRALAGEVSLGRVDIREVRRLMGKQQTGSLNGWGALGGLPYLLNSLAQRFDFDQAAPARLRDAPVWKTTGKLRSPPENIGKQTPTKVNVVLSREEAFALFPYRLEFYSEESGEAPMLVLQFYELRARPDLMPADFEYRPLAGEEIVDQTEAFLRRIGISPEG